MSTERPPICNAMVRESREGIPKDEPPKRCALPVDARWHRDPEQGRSAMCMENSLVHDAHEYEGVMVCHWPEWTPSEPEPTYTTLFGVGP